jgi:hypothetical protein
MMDHVLFPLTCNGFPLSSNTAVSKDVTENHNYIMNIDTAVVAVGLLWVKHTEFYLTWPLSP